jgi:hypothetical protein
VQVFLDSLAKKDQTTANLVKAFKLIHEGKFNEAKGVYIKQIAKIDLSKLKRTKENKLDFFGYEDEFIEHISHLVRLVKVILIDLKFLARPKI